jgi:putative exporter of polyketide antibiotics
MTATFSGAYLSALMLLASLAAAAYATSAVLRLRTEETGNLAQPVLATATGRIRWALSHICREAGKRSSQHFHRASPGEFIAAKRMER